MSDSTPLQSRLRKYALLGVGGLTFVATAADADIIFTDFSGQATQGNPLDIDMDNDGTADFTFLVDTYGPNFYGTFSWRADISGAGANMFAGIDRAPFGPIIPGPSNLGYGATISARSFYGGRGPLQMAYTAYNPGYSFGSFVAGSPAGFVGVQFLDDTGNLRFGWIGVSVAGGTANGISDVTINVEDYAYATGEPITAGQVPAPGALSLLALGGAGLAARRRKRAA